MIYLLKRGKNPICAFTFSYFPRAGVGFFNKKFYNHFSNIFAGTAKPEERLLNIVTFSYIKKETYNSNFFSVVSCMCSDKSFAKD